METVIRGYKLINLLYSNELFEVWDAFHAILPEQKCRITLIDSYFTDINEVRNEFNSSAFKLGFAEHQYIIKNNDMIEENGKFAILSESIPVTGSLTYIENISFDEKKEFVLKVLEALIYLNDRKIFHLSPEPDDILIDGNNNPRLSNYGLVEIFLKVKTEQDRDMVLANFKYSAPELIDKLGKGDDKAEVYSFGKLLNAVFGDKNSDMNAIIASATNIDRKKRFRNLIDLEKVIINPENILAFIPVPLTKNKQLDEQKLSSAINANKPRTVENIRPETTNIKQGEQTEKNIFEIVNEIENQKKTKAAAQNKQQSGGTNSANQQQQNDYNKTIEALRESAQQNQQTSGSNSINTTSVVVFGVLSIIFSFIFPFFGLGLAILGFRSAFKNTAKAKTRGRKLSSTELNSQTIGFVFCALGTIISAIKFLIYFGDILV